MVVGCLSRERALAAFQAGIKAAQISEFLTVHAHPKMKERSPIIPENVTHQLMLWEAENHRLKVQEACVIDFREIPGSTLALFEKLVVYLQQVNVLLWHSIDTMMVAVDSESGLQFVYAFVEQDQL